MEANLWFTKASIVVDTRLVFPKREKKKNSRKKKKREGRRDDKLQGSRSLCMYLYK